MSTRAEHLRLAHGPAGTSGNHFEDHVAIADHINGHRPCPTCRAVIADSDVETHRRTHIGRAIAAR